MGKWGGRGETDVEGARGTDPEQVKNKDHRRDTDYKSTPRPL